ncbi:MAG TPA: FkbM family methyltransferase [Opitutaceae bacterium]|nr:FkbM family methyltransferase [Opitutaceae bacterium]
MRDPLVPGPRRPPGWRDRLLTVVRRHNWRGFVTLYDLLKPLTGRRSLRVVTRYGSQFFLTPWDSVDTHVINEGFYESEVLEAVRPHLGADAVLWVVGANFGLHAVTAKCLHPETRVVAFEPSPAMAARILENCELNGVALELHACALADRTAILPFFANASGNPGMSTLHPVNPSYYDQRFQVAAFAAAEVIDRGFAPAPTAMILDVEGAETEVLCGFGSRLGAAGLRVLVFEAPNDFLTAREPADLHALLRDAGFSLQKLERHEHTAHALSNFVAYRP